LLQHHGVVFCVPPREAFPRAKAAAVAAVAFDGGMAEGHCSLGLVRAFFDWDWPAASAEFDQAWALDPAYWVTPFWHGLVLCATGRFDEAEEQIARGLALEPQSPVVMHGAALNATMAGRYGLALARCRRGCRTIRIIFCCGFRWGWCMGLTGRGAEAIEELEKAVELSGRRVSFVACSLAHAVAAAGHRETAWRCCGRCWPMRGARLWIRLGSR